MPAFYGHFPIVRSVITVSHYPLSNQICNAFASAITPCPNRKSTNLPTCLAHHIAMPLNARSKKRFNNGVKKTLSVHSKLNCYQIDQSHSIIISALAVEAEKKRNSARRTKTRKKRTLKAGWREETPLDKRFKMQRSSWKMRRCGAALDGKGFFLHLTSHSPPPTFRGLSGFRVRRLAAAITSN